MLYQSFVLLKNSFPSELNKAASIVVIVPLRSTAEDQLMSNDLRAFQGFNRHESSILKRNLSLTVVNECHTVKTW